VSKCKAVFDNDVDVFLSVDMKTIEQTHTFCATQVDKNIQNRTFLLWGVFVIHLHNILSLHDVLTSVGYLIVIVSLLVY